MLDLISAQVENLMHLKHSQSTEEQFIHHDFISSLMKTS